MADVRLPDGTLVTARALLERRVDDPSRDYGLYMDARWAPSWASTLIDWQDFGLPTDWHQAVAQIRSAFRRAHSGQHLEVGCAGGIGRTGTVLACMAVLAGEAGEDAVAWVREHYRSNAVETTEQERWVRWFADQVSPFRQDQFGESMPSPTVREYLASLEYPAEQIQHVERIRGLTNENYLVRLNGEELVVRIASPNAARLGIDRFAERSALLAAEVTGLGPEIVHYSLPHGHLVTRRIQAMPFEEIPEVYRSEHTAERVVSAAKRVHALPSAEHRFDPFERIRQILDEARSLRFGLPQVSNQLALKLDVIRDRWHRAGEEGDVLCHNDLFAGNLLNAQPIRILDWEFCGMGDPYFDLATLVVSCGENTPLPQHLQDVILETYTGTADRQKRARLRDMVFVVRFHAGCWGIAQQVAGRNLPPDGDFTYGEYTEAVLSALARDGEAEVRA